MKRRFSLFNTNFGSRASRVSLSPNGKYLLTRYSDNYDVKRSRTRCELTEVKTGRVILPNANEKMNWMPNSNKLYYTVMGEEQNDLVVFDPATMREEVLGGLGGLPVHSPWQRLKRWKIRFSYLVRTAVYQGKTGDHHGQA